MKRQFKIKFKYLASILKNMESYYFLPGGIESLIEKTEHSLTEMEFFFKTTRDTNAQTKTLAKQLLIMLRGMSDEPRD